LPGAQRQDRLMHDDKADGRSQTYGFFKPCIGRTHRPSAITSWAITSGAITSGAITSCAITSCAIQVRAIRPVVTVLPFPGKDDSRAGHSGPVRHRRRRRSLDLQVVNPRR